VAAADITQLVDNLVVLAVEVEHLYLTHLLLLVQLVVVERLGKEMVVDMD
jgi:hypothetical protein